MQIPADILNLIHGTSAKNAYDIIEALGHPDVHVFANQSLWKVKDIVNSEKWESAKNIGPFMFWGGSPTHLKYYKGTLYTLLCDLIFDAILARGIEETKKIIYSTQPTRERLCLTTQ